MTDQSASTSGLAEMSVDELRMLEGTVTKILSDTDRQHIVHTLNELGWFELWMEEPRAAARALFRQQGATARSSAVLTLLMGSSLPGAASNPAEAAPLLLPTIASGDREGWATPDPDGEFTALAMADSLGDAHAVLAPVMLGGSPALVRVDTADLTVTSIGGIDPAMGLCSVRFHSPGGSTETVAVGEDAQAGWSRALALGRRLVAEELVGVVEQQQRLALEHARSREQFGRPIGSFQAVKHKLAEVHVATVTAGLAIEEAWTNHDVVASMVAKFLASAAVDLANAHCQQVLGGIGFTWEHSFHHYARRGRMLASLLGSRTQLAKELGVGILASRKLPVLAGL